MPVKAKTKPAGKIISKPPTKFNPLNNLSQLIVIKNKKVTAVIILAIVLVVALLFVLKSVFIAAMVNGEPVSRLSVVKALEKQGGKTTLDSLITKKLILQEAKKRNLAVTQNDIDLEIKKITANLQTQGSTLDQALASQGMTKSALNDEIRIQVAINKMVGTDVLVTEKEIDDFVAANKAQMAEGTTQAQFRQQATQQLKQQKLQAKTQDFIKSLQDKAKVIHFVSY